MEVSTIPDKYDIAVEYLTQNPHMIFKSWNLPYESPGGCLFRALPGFDRNGDKCGCLTQIRRAMDPYIDPTLPLYEAPTEELTYRIRRDERIPTEGQYITVEDLPVFAWWQRRLDLEFGEDR